MDVDETADVVVVGGGMGGLIAAVTAARAGSGRVVLCEPHPLGGRARCEQRAGFTFNRGPHALYVDGPADRALRALGLDTSRGGPPKVGGGGAVDGGEVHLFPTGPGSALRTSLMSASEKFAFAKAFARIPRIDPATVTGRTGGPAVGVGRARGTRPSREGRGGTTWRADVRAARRPRRGRPPPPPRPRRPARGRR